MGIQENKTNGDLFELDQPFTYAEIEEAINKLSNDKSPGPDGIPSEFYKYTFNRLHNCLEINV